MAYYILINGIQQGPYPAEELVAQGLKRSTPVWCEGMPDWTPAEQVEDLQHIVRTLPPDSFRSANNAYAQTNTQAPKSHTPHRVADPEGRPCPKSWYPEAIITTVISALCCNCLSTVLGIIAIIYASKVESLYATGNYEGAANSASTAKTLTTISIIIAIVGGILQVVFGVFTHLMQLAHL